MSRFVISFENDNVSPTGEVAGAVFEIEKDIEKDREIAGADIGDISSDETQARIEEVLSIEALEEEIDTEIVDSNRVEEVSDSLLDLSQIVERIEHPSETDIALIQTAANMAVAGTEVDAQDILPAMESFTDMKVAAEGIGERANEAMNSLRESAAALSAKVGEYIKKLFGSLAYRERTLADLKAKVNALPNTAQTTINVRGNTWLMTDKKEAITDTKSLLAAAKDSVAMYSQYSDAYINLANSFKGAIAKYYTTGVGEKSDDHRDKLAKVWFDDFLGKMSKLRGMEANDRLSKPGFTVYASPAYLGADRIIVTVPTASITSTTSGGQLRTAISGSSFDVRSTLGVVDNVKKTVAPDRVALDLTKNDLKQFVQLAESQISNMKKFLDKNYKAAQTWNTVGMGSSGQHGSALARLTAKGRNTQFIMALWTKRYGDGLLNTLERIISAGVGKAGSSVTTESQIATEAFGGGFAGFLTGALPGVGPVIFNVAAKNEIEHKKKQIDAVTKQIEKLKNLSAKEALEQEKITPKSYEVIRNLDSVAILEGVVYGIIPIVSMFSRINSGSELENKMVELKKLVKEFETLYSKAESEHKRDSSK